MSGDWTERIGAPATHEPIAAQYYNEEFERGAARIMGSREIPDCLKRVAGCPWLSTAMIPFFMRHDTVFAEPESAAWVVLLSSAVNDCRYSYGLFRSRLLLAGRREEEIDSMTEAAVTGNARPEVSDGQRALVELARLASHPQRDRDGAARARVFDHLGRTGISGQAANELAACAAQTGFFNRVCTLLAVPPDAKAEAIPRKFYIPLLRPFIASVVRGRKVAATRPPDDDSPFSGRVRDLAGTWYALWMSITADSCLEAENDEIGTAERLSVIELIAEATGAEMVRKEASQRLSAFPAHRIPDRIERWCRLTIDYRAAEGQESTAGLAGEVGAQALVDLVGTAALANLLSRLELLGAPPQ